MILDAASLAASWPDAGGRRLVEQRRPDRTLFLAVDHHPEHGFRIEAPGYGTHVVAADGRTWVGQPAGGEPAWRWRELVFAQVLPTVAALHGLEPLHASAVAIDGRVHGLLAASGVGKSSTAAHLVGRGAQFVTDDVLVLEEIAGRLVAHPGPRLAKLHGHELAAMTPAARRRLGTASGEHDGKQHLRPSGPGGPLPLGGLLFLTRVAGGAEVTIAPAADSVPRLLASAFAPHVATPLRLDRQLAVCAAAHRDVALWRVGVPPGCTAADVAGAVWTHLSPRGGASLES